MALVAKAPLAIAIGKDVPVRRREGLIAHAKANPGKLTFADRLPGFGGAPLDRAAEARRQASIT